MNRIVIIGNGFDLAHGLKTGYRNFIDDLWKREKEKVLSMEISRYSGSDNEYTYEFICDFHKIYTNIPSVRNIAKGCAYDWFKDINSIPNTQLWIKNAFLETISEKIQLQNWVDIEEEYYRELNVCLKNNRYGGIEKLNEEFSEIKIALQKYLENIPKVISAGDGRILQHLKKIAPNGKPIDNMAFLSFNYTNTIDYYTIYNEPIIHIHGKLKDPDNPIIFGYGNEHDDNHKLIEDKNDNEYLKHIKSVEYLKNNNYKKLQAFIESDKYEIFIMGHSCGISDRTLLNNLFEHKHCRSIKVFYHKKEDDSDNYNDLVCNIYRNFNDKNAMRIKVVSKEGCEPLLQ
jgi:hypothetical protein